MRLRRRCLLAGALGAPLGACADVHRLRVLAPPPSLQQLVFWVAMGGGAFIDAELEVGLEVLEHPSQAGPSLGEGRVDVAILDAGTALGLVARDAPIVLVGRLWAREPATVVVHRRLFASSPLPPDASLPERASRLTGLRLAMEPALEARFAALWRDTGLPAHERPTILRIGPKRQNLALARGDAEALFATSPVLEHALVRQGAELLIAPARGEVPALADIAGGTVVATRAAVDGKPHALARLLAGLTQAMRWIHLDPQVAVSAALEVVPDRLPREVEEGVLLWGAAIPPDARPRASALAAHADLVAVDGPRPRSAQIEERIDPRYALAATMPAVSRRPLGLPLSMIGAGALIGWWIAGA